MARAHLDLEERVKARAAQLEQSNRELADFSYSVAHDLRSPIRAIDGFARMIRKEYGKTFDRELLRKFEVIENTASRMGRLIDDLLDLSRLGRKDLDRVPVNMELLAADVMKEIKQYESKGRLKIELDKMPPALGDSGLIRLVVYHLLSNAVKFTKKVSKPSIRIGGRREGKFNVYYVKDNGVGFEMAYYD